MKYALIRKAYELPFIIENDHVTTMAHYMILARGLNLDEARAKMVEYFELNAGYYASTTDNELLADQGLHDETN